MISLTFHIAVRPLVRLVPERWDELTAEQLQAIAMAQYDDISDLARCIAITRILCGLTPAQFARLPEEIVAEELIELTRWIYDACDLTTQLIPLFRRRFRSFIGPESHLRNIRFAEFDAAERALHAWHQVPGDIALLYNFVAVLYRPRRRRYDHRQNPDGDRRELFNDNLVEARARLLQRTMPRGIAYAISLWYKGCRQFITASFPRVFLSSDANQSGDPEQPAYFGLIRMIAKEGIYGNYNEVENLLIYNALTEIEAVADEREALREAMESGKSDDYGA